jgi:hypothetical protein
MKENNEILIPMDDEINQKYLKWSSKESELCNEVNQLLKYLKTLPDDKWKTSDMWYELVVACYKYKLHFQKLYKIYQNKNIKIKKEAEYGQLGL